MRTGPGHATCLVVADDGVRAYGPSGGSAFDWPVEADTDGAVEMVRALEHAVGKRNRVCVVLMPPLVDVQAIDLPPLRSSEIAAVIAHHGARYFPRGTKGAAVGWIRRRRAGAHPGTAVLAAAADEARLTPMLRSLEAAGQRDVAAIPAHVAWVEAAKQEGALRRSRDGVVCVEATSSWLLLVVRGGEIAGCARFALRGLAALVQRVDASCRPDGTVTIIGAGPLSGELDDALRGGSSVDPVRLAADPAEMAARYAHRCAGPRVLPEPIIVARRKRRRRAEWLRCAVAVGLVLLAWVVDTRRMHRDLEAVRSVRARHATEVEEALALQEDLAEMGVWLAWTTDQFERTPRWSRWLTVVAEQLPRGARLERFAGRPGEIEVSGSSPSATDVLSALERLPGVVGVDLARPIRRVDGSGGVPEDHFSFLVRVEPRTAP